MARKVQIVGTERALKHRPLSGDDLLDMLCAASESRAARNGFTQAMDIVHLTLPKAFAKDGGPTIDEVRKRVIDEIYGPLLGDNDFSESVLRACIQETFKRGLCVDVTYEVVAYCVFAVRAYFDGDESLSWSYASDASYWAGVVMMVAKQRGLPAPAVIRKQLADLRSSQARAAAQAKLANDPVQAAKAEAFKLWQERHAGKHPKLGTNEQFATECMRRWPVLTSSKVICGWCTAWTKEAKAKQSQSAS